MSDHETRECLLCLRVPLEKIREKVKILLPAGHCHDVADRIAERAAKLIYSAYEKDRTALCGRKPSGIMASAIYVSARMEDGVNISQAKVAEAISTSELTLRTGVRQIKELLGLDITRFPDRRERYECPFCDEAFTSLDDLKLHLWRKNVKYSSTLRVAMFNEEGALVDEEILEKMRNTLE